MQLFEKFLIRANDGKFYRCARFPIDDDKLDASIFMRLFLLDIGDEFLMGILEIPEETLFEMPESLKDLEGLAIKCTWKDIELEHQFETAQSFLANSLYRKFTFEVVNVLQNSELKVNIMPFDEFSIFEESDIEKTSEKSKSEGEPKAEETEGIDLHLDLHKEPISTSLKDEKNEVISESDRAIWNEEPLNTCDAQVAVQGFSTRDDERLCKFYDPKLGGCFKGGRCKLRHRLEIKDGTCRDAKKIYIENISKVLPSPALHSSVKIDIISFYNVSKFICRYAKLKNPKGGSNLETLIDHMNEEEEIKTYSPMTYYPAIKQLVFVKSSDDRFYRARVESLLNGEKAVKLLLLDLGTIEEAQCNRIYNWCTRFNYLSFQTIEMEIANIQPLPQNTGDKEGIAIILDYLKQSKYSLKAVVFENVIGIKISIFNIHGEDIGQELVDRKFAAEKAIGPPTPVNLNSFIPG